MLSRLLLSLFNRLQLVEKLAESGPIRRAAQITAAALIRAQIAGRDASQRALRSQSLRQVREEALRGPGNLADLQNRVRRVKDTVVKEVKDGWKDANSRGLRK